MAVGRNFLQKRGKLRSEIEKGFLVIVKLFLFAIDYWLFIVGWDFYERRGFHIF